jgi:hypothetical protein
MKLYSYSEDVPDFGEALNAWLWPKLIPEVVADASDDDLFLGIGSVLSNRIPSEPRKRVIGSGFGGYRAKPAIDERWTFYFVRGPRTARALGLDEALAITDAAILVGTVASVQQQADRRYPVSFMPHLKSAHFGVWKEAAELAGIHFLDPHHPIPRVLAELKASDLLVTEALHGAVVADALRVPWIPILPPGPSRRFKWLDWCESLSIDSRPHSAAPSSLGEFVKARELDSFYPAELVKRTTGRRGGGLDRFLKTHAAKRLREIMQQEPLLSGDALCAAKTQQAYRKLMALRADFDLLQTRSLRA